METVTKQKSVKVLRKVMPTACLALLCYQVHSATLTFSGSVNAVKPSVNFQHTEQPIAHVNNFFIEAQKDAKECDLLTDEWEADNTFMEGAKPLCLFEWTDVPAELTKTGLALRGILSRSDDVKFSYQISILDKGEKHTLIRDTVTLSVLEPVPPKINSLAAVWIDGEVAGQQQNNFNRQRSLIGLHVNVEPRPFEQLLKYKNEKCTVQTGETACSLKLSPTVPGLQSDELVGSEIEALELTDVVEYFAPNLELVTIDYDYRPPEVENFVINGFGSNTIISHDVAGERFDIQQNQALLVLKTPHSDKTGNWWTPAVKSIRLTAQENEQFTRTLTIRGKEIDFPIVSPNPNSSYRLPVVNELQQYGDYFIATFDISDVPDGKYSVHLDVEDLYSNASKYNKDDHIIDRYGSPIVALLDETILRPESYAEYYFQNELAFAAYSGWNEGTKITRITRNGKEIPFTRIDDYAVELLPDDALLAGEEVLYRIESVDGVGNVEQQEYKLRHNPTEFALFGRTENIYESIQPIDFKLLQRKGSRCTMVSSDDTAIAITSPFKKGCVIEIKGLPTTITPELKPKLVKLEGIVNEVGEHTIGYDVKYFTKSGDSKVVFSGSKTIHVTETPNVQLNLTELNKISDGVYSVPYESEKITKVEYEAANGSLIFKTKNDTGEKERRQRGSDKFSIRKGSYFIERVNDLGTDLWQRKPYTITGDYELLDNHGDTHVFDVVVTPHSRTKAYLTITSIENATTENDISINMLVGFYNRKTGVNFYDKSIMGDWTLQLFVRGDEGDKPLSDEMTINENGEVTFNLSGNVLFDAGERFYAVARSVGGVTGFEMVLESRDNLYKVLKGSGPEGSIDEHLIKGQIPFAGILAFEFDSTKDREVAGQKIWQISKDDSNWTDIPGSEDSLRMRFTQEEPGETFYRFKVVNVYTGAVSYSNSVRIVGYETKEFEINGPKKLLKGQVGEFTVTPVGQLVGSTKGTYEYSIDGKSTWHEFMESFSLSSDSDFAVYVRSKLDSTFLDVVGDDAYSEERWLVKVEEPRPLQVELSSDYRAEVGYPISLKGSAKYPDSSVQGTILSEIELPSGEVVSSSELEYLVKESDVVDGKTLFKYRAWMEGFKEQTIAEKQRTVTTYKYEFPKPNFYVSRYYALAPTTLELMILNLRTDVDDVKFEVSWQYDQSKLQLIEQKGNEIKLRAQSAGLHKVSAMISDNRGNSEIVEEFITVDEAPPLEVDIKSYVYSERLHVPVALSMRGLVYLSHDDDRIDSIEWMVDGQRVESDSFSQTFNFDTAGKKEITFRANTIFGQTSEKTIAFDLLPNVPPSCKPELQSYDTYYMVRHNCSDTDGKLVQVSYDFGVGRVNFVSRELRFDKDKFPTATVVITATDNGGEQATYDVKW